MDDVGEVRFEFHCWAMTMVRDIEQGNKKSQKTTNKKRDVRLNKLRKWLWIALLLFAGAAGVCIALPFWLAGPSDVLTHAAVPNHPGPAISDTKAPDNALTAITLNMAHGRLDQAMNPFASRERAEANLQVIADTLERENPDLVALQEADTNSFWNGSFDHVRFIAEKMGWPYCINGQQVRGLNLHYGTALLSRLPMSDCSSTTFSSALFSLPKGYVKATVSWPGNPEVKIDVISLHLDFMRASLRQRQIDELISHIESSENPLIVMGDFNSTWDNADSAVMRLVQELHLKISEPEATDMNTYPGTYKRLDWILVSSCMHFQSYAVLPDPLSDHLAVKAVITLDADKASN